MDDDCSGPNWLEPLQVFYGVIRSNEARHCRLCSIEGLGRFAEIDEAFDGAEYDYDVAGLALGADVVVGAGNARIGIAGGFTQTDASMRQRSSRADIDSYHAGLYGMVETGRVFVDARASYARHEIDATRGITISAANGRTAIGNTDADEIRGALKLGTDLGSSATTIWPYVSLVYVSVDESGLTETNAGDVGLVVGSNDHEAGTVAIGAHLGWTLPVGTGTIRPFADLSLAHDIVQDGWVSSARMIGGGAPLPLSVRSPGARQVSRTSALRLRSAVLTSASATVLKSGIV